MINVFSFKQRSEQPYFERVLRPHIGALYIFAYRLTGNRADSEDLLQDLMLKLHDRQQQVLSLEHPASWLKKVLYNLYVDSYRRAQHRPTAIADRANTGADDPLMEIPSADAGPELLMQRTQDQALLQQAIDSLKDNQRIIILLHDVDGVSMKELQQILDEPLGTLKARLHRARKELRVLLKDATF